MQALDSLVRWARAIRSAEVDADRYLRSAKLAARDVSKQLANIPGAEAFVRVTSAISALSDVDGVAEIARRLLSIPLPLPLFVEVSRPLRHQTTTSTAKEPGVVVAFTSFRIDGLPFGDPHTIQPEMLHDLNVAVTVSNWPPSATELVLEAMSVEPAASYDLPKFSFQRPSGNPPYAVAQTGRLLIHHPVALYARPLQFTYKARFEPNVATSSVSVQGHRHLRMQSFDPAREPQSGYSVVDTRLFEIRDQVRSAISASDAELNSFFSLLTVVGGIAGQSLQDNLFSRKYPEDEFQEELRKLLRQNPRIGSQLEEHPRAGGGITDLSFQGVRLELKSEQEKVVTLDIASAFVPQTAQYVAGSDRRFGLLCILDCSPKNQAPGLPSGDIFAVSVPPPAGSGAPICIGVVIIRGNLARPSDLSR